MSLRINIRQYRTVTIPTDHVKSSAGLEPNAPNDKAAQQIKERYGPHMAPGFKIFWSEEAARKTVVGMEVMSFELSDPKVAQAGLIIHDPISPDEVHRVDGALYSELCRLGIYYTKPDDYEWRIWYELKNQGSQPPDMPTMPAPGRMG